MIISMDWAFAKNILVLTEKNYKIAAIKCVRENSPLGLKAAKDVVEALVAGQFQLHPDSFKATSALVKIDAIEYIRIGPHS